MSDEKRRSQLNAARHKSRDVNVSFNLGKLQSSKLSSNNKEKSLEIYLDDLLGLLRWILVDD